MQQEESLMRSRSWTRFSRKNSECHGESMMKAHHEERWACQSQSGCAFGVEKRLLLLLPIHCFEVGCQQHDVFRCEELVHFYVENWYTDRNSKNWKEVSFTPHFFLPVFEREKEEIDDPSFFGVEIFAS